MDHGDPWGVAHGWWGTDGRYHEPSPETRAALHSALGAEDHPAGPPPGPHTWFVAAGDEPALWGTATVELEDGSEVVATQRLPPDLPLGAHELRPHDEGPTTRLFVVARRSPKAPRCWGWSTQLYATRSAASWGMGDLGDLAGICREAGALGAGVVAHNPIGASLPVGRQQPSPYYTSSRSYWSPLYLRIESVPGAAAAAGEVERCARAGRELARADRIERDRIWELKLAALEAIWTATRPGPPPEHDPDADRFALFNALAEHHGSGWSRWPADVSHPEGPGIRAFRADHHERVAFWRWVQVCCDGQLAAAASAGAPLMADLPVGFDPDGFDAWVDQDLLALGTRIGAPPDEFNTLGQDWGLPPYVPWRLRAAGYRPWLTTLRRVLRDAGALRVDHVMGLFRLFLLPEGADARDGAYVLQHGSELLDLAVTEAARAGATLVGEDLGTVDPAVRDAMASRDVYGYRIGWFTDDEPHTWPPTTLAALTTHDLPTAHGLWDGTDTADRARAGVPPDPDGDSQLRSRLGQLAGVDPGTSVGSTQGATPATRVPERDVVLDAYRTLAASGSDIVLATLEDAVGARHRPNLPGTVDEHPNWSVPLPVDLEQLGPTGADQLAEVLRAARPAPRRPGEPATAPR